MWCMCRPIGLGIAWDHKTVYDYWEPYNPCEVDASIQEWGKEKRTPCNSIENRLVPVPGYCTSCSMRNMSRGVVPPNALKLNFSTDLLEANLGDNYSIFLDVCLKRSKVVITACSFMDLESWNAIGKTLDLGERTKDGMFPLIVIGTKGDLMGKAVQPEEAQAYCAKLGLPFVETSSLTGKGVKKAIKEAILEYIALDVMGRSPPTRPRIKRKFLAWDIGQEAQITTNTVSKEKPLDTNLNILLVGDPGVGKSAFISRYTSGLFITDYMPTIEDSIRANCTLGDDDDDDDDDYNNNNNGDGDVRMYTTRACNYMALAAAPMCCSTITAAAADVAAASFCSVESMKFENAGFGAAAPPPPPPPPMAGAAPPPPPMTAAAAQPGMLFGAAAAAAPPPPPPPMAGAAAAPPPPVTMKKMKKMEAPHKNMCDEEVDEDEENDDSEYSDYYYYDDDDEDDDEAGYDYMSYGCLADECNYTKSFPKAKKSSKFCFIATAAYGTPLDPRLDSLRWFRDTWLPCWFVDAYYAVSPPIAHWIEDHEWARFVVRCLIWPIVQAIDHPLEAFLLVLSLLTVIASYLIYAIIFSNH